MAGRVDWGLPNILDGGAGGRASNRGTREVVLVKPLQTETHFANTVCQPHNNPNSVSHTAVQPLTPAANTRTFTGTNDGHPHIGKVPSGYHTGRQHHTSAA